MAAEEEGRREGGREGAGEGCGCQTLRQVALTASDSVSPFDGQSVAWPIPTRTIKAAIKQSNHGRITIEL